MTNEYPGIDVPHHDPSATQPDSAMERANRIQKAAFELWALNKPKELHALIAAEIRAAVEEANLVMKRDPSNCLRCGHAKGAHNVHGYCFGSDPTEVETRCVCTWIQGTKADAYEDAAKIAETRFHNVNRTHALDAGIEIAKAIRAQAKGGI